MFKEIFKIALGVIAGMAILKYLPEGIKKYVA